MAQLLVAELGIKLLSTPPPQTASASNNWLSCPLLAYSWSVWGVPLGYIHISIYIFFFLYTVESLQSHFILTMSHLSSELPVCFMSQGTRVQISWGVFMWNRDSPFCVVSLHWWRRHEWSLWPQLRRALSLTITWPLYQQCDNPTWSHTAFLSRFHARCRFPFRLHNQQSQLLGGGGAMWIPGKLT